MAELMEGKGWCELLGGSNGQSLVMGGILMDIKRGVKDCQVSGPDDWGWGDVCLHGDDTEEEQCGGREEEFS